MGAATDNLESDKLIHSAQKEVYGPETIRDSAIIIRRGGGGALHKIAAKIGGLKVKSLI